MALVASLKRRWRTFRNDPPGRRFQERHRRNRASRPGFLLRLAFFLGGILLLAVGIVFMLIPGPGIPIAVAGAALVAGESRPAARALDWLELRVRKLWRGKRLE